MPRLVEERWVGVGFDVVEEELQVADEHGRPQLAEDGSPRTARHTTLVFVLPAADGQRLVRVPFDERSKQELVAKLTGGIMVPAARF